MAQRRNRLNAPLLRRITLISVALLLVACGGGGSDSSPSTPVSAVSVDQILQNGVDRGVDGIWLYTDDGAAPTTKAFGISSRSTQTPSRQNDLFRIASISKLFIAVSAVKLVEQNLITLDDTLAFWLPQEAAQIANAERITVRQLLQHRSGVPDFDTEPGFSWTRPHTDEEALLQLIYGEPADFEPDAQYEYSNTNYLLLGRILNTALAYHHHDFVQNSILTPLGMTDTYSLLSDVDTALLARGYWDGVDRTTQDYVIPGGSMVSTARDVGVFIRALAQGDLLTAQERNNFASLYDGYGHSGWLPGFQSRARYYADIDTVIVQFVNTTGGSSEEIASDVHQGVLDFLRGN